MSTIFDNFTNLYSLSKTLRFELKPVGKTLENMRQHLRYDENLQTFLADQEIEDAYQTLKPIFDSLHEEFITKSLESVIAQKIDFSEYLEKYKNKEDFENLEKPFRIVFEKAYEEAGEILKVKAGKNTKGKDILTEKGYKILTEKGILDYIRNNIKDFSEIKSSTEIEIALKAFEGFFTYFGGFNQNRENYYETGKEASTAVASRIVHENLPKFCDNILFFESRAQEYKNSYNILQKLERSLVNKKKEPLFPIVEGIFKIGYFNECFSQRQIEKYNDQIGNANFLINLYNQVKKDENGFKKLQFFKILYKQIGCGKRSSLFFTLTHDKKSESEKPRNEGKEAYSVEEVLEKAKEAGEKYFDGKSDDGMVNTVDDFLDDLRSRENYLGIYWSKAAINTISNKYFANWHELKDELKKAKVFLKASKEADEDVKIPEAIELEGLFHVLDQTENWKDLLFKASITTDEKKKKIIDNSQTASQALLELLFSDIEEHKNAFLQGSSSVLKLNEYKNGKSKEVIKSWLDHALTVNQMLKYFLVKGNKIKGVPLDSTISQALDTFLRSEDVDWFKWYDALRNYLTKKPQDDVKENKLKLNFENGSLLGGWSDGQEKTKAAVLLRKNNFYYLGVLKKKSLFDTAKENNLIYKNTNAGGERLILANLKFQTLAGKGFLGKYGKSYGEMGKEDSQKAMNSLKEIIRERYIKKYVLLVPIVEKSYINKKDFDNDIQKTLADSYVCEFIPVNWSEIQKNIDSGDMYLFQIYSKDFSEKSVGHKDLQTLYWNAVFEENSPFQLNGGGEIFYRRPAIKESDKKVKKGYEQKKFILENKRFTAEKFLFHCPIKLNYKAKNYSAPKYAIPDVNKRVNEKLFKNDDIYFLGIDRGEKHLAYYSLVDKNGVIIKQGTLNMPFVDKDGKPHIVKVEKRTINKNGEEKIETVDCRDYNELLEARAGDRNYARKNWQTIGTIKELKAGYISQVVRKIADLAVEHDAFIVLENLNTGFKRGRQKIEKSVYQKLELSLAKKLNFLVDKKAKNGETGSVTNAIQLTPPITNYGDIENKKQVGIMLYTRANYTSQTDPVTGWRKSIYLQKGSEENIKSQIVQKFSDIGFDGKDYFFVYKDESTGKEWKLYSGKSAQSLDRYRGERGKDKNEWVIRKCDIVEILDGVFANFDKKRSIYSQIVDEGLEPEKIGEHTAWESLRFAIDLIQQIRNTGMTEGDNDFLLSPVRDQNGIHFDSRTAAPNQPNSGDANGAYNIARKGILMNEHIKRGYNLFISDAEWDAWLVDKKVWDKWIKENEELIKPKGFKKSNKKLTNS